MSFVVFILIFLLLVNSGYSEVIKLPPEGELYDIKEKDALEEIYEKAKKLDLNLFRQRMLESAEKMLNVNYSLGKACKSKRISFQPFYTLPFDIVDQYGRVIYPKGYTFNPLDYIKGLSSRKLVFFNGKSEVERKWLLKQKELLESAVLIAVKGNIRELVNTFKKPVYAFNEEMKERFRVERTPSIVSFKGNEVVIEEVGIYECKE